MAPKVVTNPTKLASVLAYFHTSGVAHSIKDLEKALPSVASVNSMQVKDYLGALADDNKIYVEKIGSGNWYWAFASEEKRGLEVEVEALEGDVEKGVALVDELKAKVAQETTLRAETEDEASDGEMSSGELTTVKSSLEAEVEALRKEVAAHSDNDPVEVDRKKAEVQRLKDEICKWTEHIESIESYFVGTLGADREGMEVLKRDLYGSEFDEETGGMKDLGL